MTQRIRPRNPRADLETRNLYRRLSGTDQTATDAGSGGSVSRTSQFTDVVDGTAYLSVSDYVVRVKSLSPTLYLPDAVYAENGKRLRVENHYGAGSTINIYTVAAQTIDGSSSATINTYPGTKTFRSDGANWTTE